MYKTILLAIDLNEASSWDKALPVALEQARAGGGQLHVMTVVPDFGMAIVGSFFPADYEKQALAEAGGRDRLGIIADTDHPTAALAREVLGEAIA